MSSIKSKFAAAMICDFTIPHPLISNGVIDVEAAKNAIALAELEAESRAIKAFKKMVEKFQECELDVCDHSQVLEREFVELMDQ